MAKSKKEIIKRFEKTCSICGRKMKVILYKDRSYRGGHYFGKIPFYTKKELNKALKAGTCILLATGSFYAAHIFCYQNARNEERCVKLKENPDAVQSEYSAGPIESQFESITTTATATTIPGIYGNLTNQF